MVAAPPPPQSIPTVHTRIVLHYHIIVCNRGSRILTDVPRRSSRPETMALYAVRRAKEADIDDIMRLIKGLAEHEGVVYTMPTEILMEDAFGDSPCLHFYLAVFQDGTERKVVGFASTNDKNHFLCTGRATNLSGLFIEKQHRGKGLGTALLKAASKDCLALGHKVMFWDVINEPSHQRTMEFYLSLGVVNTTEKRHKEFWEFKQDAMATFVNDMELRCPNDVSIKFETT